MKIFKQILFAVLLVAGFSITASAQQNDGKKTPPKERPPVIFIEPKKGDKPKEDKPKDERKDNKGKKPEMFF